MSREPIVAAAPSRSAWSDGFDAFYREMAPRLVVIGRSITGNRATAEEAAQEALFIAHRRWDHVRSLDRPDLWVRRVATNLCISIWRRRIVEHRANQRHVQIDLVSEVAAADDRTDEPLWAELRRLPRRQAAALSLHYVDQLSTAEIGAVLGCSASTVQTHLARGRAALRERLRIDEGGTA